MSDSAYFIGIISGTSMDAIDSVVIHLRGDKLDLIAFHTSKYPSDIRRQLFEVCANPTLSLRDFGQLNVAVGKVFGDSINELLDASCLKPTDITAIGSHGQTVFHAPEAAHAFSLQIGDPNTIATVTGITTVADFRQRDVTAGGQGAPLAPLFHQYFFKKRAAPQCILNIGGISNITWLNNAEGLSTPVGFDTGPGNALMDLWVSRWLRLPYDTDGAWAASGTVVPALLQKFLTESYFQKPAPKSTGRELFNQDWLENCLKAVSPQLPQDVQRTLLELTARTITNALMETHPDKSNPTVELLVCGGGVYNKTLMLRLQQLLPDSEVSSTALHGMPPEWIEACTFAWLASKTINREKVDTRVLTGAQRPVVLGGVYFS